MGVTPPLPTKADLIRQLSPVIELPEVRETRNKSPPLELPEIRETRKKSTA